MDTTSRNEMLESDYFAAVFYQLKEKRMGEAIRTLQELMERNRTVVADNNYHNIIDDYNRLLDYTEQGYQDPMREEIYLKLVKRLWNFTCNAQMAWLSNNKPMFREARQKSAQHMFSHEEIQRNLHNFVSDAAMLSLEEDEAKEQKETDLYARHAEYVSTLFNHIFVSGLWNQSSCTFYTELILSPMTDSVDARILVSAITLNCFLQFDIQKFSTLIEVHEKSDDPLLRERAFVGWVLALRLFEPSLFPEFAQRLKDVCSRHTDELLELQQQIVSCINAESDNETLQNDIMPNIMKNSGYKLTRRGIEEFEDPLEDILDSDAADKRMEEAEKNINKILDMQRHGSDIYFGSFKMMKRFAFFYTISNWFTPFYFQHPALSSLRKDFQTNKFITGIINKGPFCDSDKYSFALGASNVISTLPTDVLKMMENIEDIDPAMAPELTASPMFKRQVYLQDLYRFFRIHPQHTDLPYDPFHVDAVKANSNYFVLDHDIFSDSDDFHIMLMRARYHYQIRRYGDVVEELYNIVDKHPDNMQARALMANALLEIGSYSEAADHYEQLLNVRPGHFKYKLNHALALIKAGRFEEAMDDVFQLSYEHPDDSRIMRLLAWALLIQKRDEQAEHYYDKLLESGNANPTDKLNAAYCYWFRGKIKQSVELFREYVQKKNTPLELAFIDDEELLRVYEVSDFDKQLIMELTARKP
ncbi:MAG: tetratricopeptide repeat protein [Prevotella sp.]|nr:tetratricopeptide repeat protein [Prevotella sp.]